MLQAVVGPCGAETVSRLVRGERGERLGFLPKYDSLSYLFVYLGMYFLYSSVYSVYSLCIRVFRVFSGIQDEIPKYKCILVFFVFLVFLALGLEYILSKIHFQI